MATVEIDGATYSMDAPCAVAEALRAVRVTVVTGGQPRTVRFGQDEVTYRTTDLAALDREIERYGRLCEATKAKPRRVRYAKRIRFI